MTAPDRRAFALGWVVVSYFLVLGGITAALIAALALENRERFHVYALVGAGAAVGGIFAGRASPHRSVLEPPLAGALVVGSLIAFMSRTSLGQLIYVFAEDAMWREAGYLAAIAFVGGLGGAIIGEFTAPQPPAEGALRWMGLTVLITAGALMASLVVSHVLMVDRAFRDAGVFGLARLTEDDLVWALVVALAAAAFLGGFVTQAAAPCRHLLAIGIAVLLAYAGMRLSVIDRSAPRGGLDDRTLIGIAVIAGGGGALALIGAALGWAFKRILP